MDKLRTAAGLSAALLVAACVTVNIYFPAAAAEKAADKIIQDVWGSQPGQKPAKPPAESSPSRDSGSADPPRSVLDRLVPAAQAAADIDISTPAIERLTASMKSRHPLLEPYFNSGAVGLTANGLLELRDLKAVPLAERTRVRELVAQQNQARSALYREIASANGHPEWGPEIRSTFARRWIANAPRGWRYQTDAGQWRQK
jgi:uncharacterized protein YdbL (DUF1318 family)